MAEVFFWVVVTGHHAIIFSNLIAAVWLPLNTHPLLACPVVTWIAWLIFARVECPLTRLENTLRKRTGRKPIGGFVGHYYFRKGHKDAG